MEEPCTCIPKSDPFNIAPLLPVSSLLFEKVD